MDETFSYNHYRCCSRCQHYNSCLLRWIRAERGQPDCCCSLCQEATLCYEKILPEHRLDDDPVPSDLTEEEALALTLAAHAYACCPQCPQFSDCAVRRRRSEEEKPEHCCPSCPSARRCYEDVQGVGTHGVHCAS